MFTGPVNLATLLNGHHVCRLCAIFRLRNCVDFDVWELTVSAVLPDPEGAGKAGARERVAMSTGSVRQR